MSLHPNVTHAQDALTQLGFPRQQTNDRSACVLLALLDLTPDRTWPEARAVVLGITPIMDWMRVHYGKAYKPNTRETIRRQTMHQFVAAGLVVMNPDDAARPRNSAKTSYVVSDEALSVLRTYGSLAWASNAAAYLGARPALAERYRQTRDMAQTPVVLPDGSAVVLSPGIHSELIRDVVEAFAPRFAPGATLLYAGDTGSKLGVFDGDALARLGVHLDLHGKMPDVVLHDASRNWLLLVEAVTSHGPVDPKRHDELRVLFGASSAGLVFVTAFPDRQTMSRYLPEIAWETEAWVADAPSHLIHFNGNRFLGPHEPTTETASR